MSAAGQFSLSSAVADLIEMVRVARFVHVVAAVVPGGYPRIVENPTLKSVEKDRNTVMICQATGDPEPSITWYKDYLPVDMSDPRRKLLPTGELSLY